MEKKQTNYIKYPLLLIGFILCICGVRWLINDEPWILDQVANEERLQMSFVDLFLIEGNTTLSAYLTQIYRFLGLYVFGLGFFLLSFSTSRIRGIRVSETYLPPKDPKYPFSSGSFLKEFLIVIK